MHAVPAPHLDPATHLHRPEYDEGEWGGGKAAVEVNVHCENDQKLKDKSSYLSFLVFGFLFFVHFTHVAAPREQSEEEQPKRTKPCTKRTTLRLPSVWVH